MTLDFHQRKSLKNRGYRIDSHGTWIAIKKSIRFNIV